MFQFDSISIRKLSIQFDFLFQFWFDSMNIDLIQILYIYIKKEQWTSLQVNKKKLTATNLYIKLFLF